MPTSNAEELGLFLKCTVIGRGVFGPCACTVKSLRLHCKELGMTVLGEAGESQTYDAFLVLFRIFKRLFKTYIIA